MGGLGTSVDGNLKDPVGKWMEGETIERDDRKWGSVFQGQAKPGIREISTKLQRRHKLRHLAIMGE